MNTQNPVYRVVRSFGSAEWGQGINVLYEGQDPQKARLVASTVDLRKLEEVCMYVNGQRAASVSRGSF